MWRGKQNAWVHLLSTSGSDGRLGHDEEQPQLYDWWIGFTIVLLINVTAVVIVIIAAQERQPGAIHACNFKMIHLRHEHMFAFA